MNVKILPQSAEALLIALQTPSFRGAMGIPTLIWGKPGEGKSSFLEGLERPGFPVLTLIASIHDPTDFSGLPIAVGDTVHYAKPEWLNTFEETGEGILFLDELTTAPPSVQAALLRVVLERKVGFHKLPDGVRIVAAANPPDLMTGGWELSPPLRNRFLHLQWSLHTDAYRQALTAGYPQVSLPQVPEETHRAALQRYRLLLDGFLKVSPGLLSSSPEGNRYGFASPRAWDMAIALMASASVLKLDPVANPNTQSAVFSELVTGCLGEGVATSFIQYLRNIKLPDPEAVLEGKIPFSIKNLNESELYILFESFKPFLNLQASDEDILRRQQVFFRIIDESISLNRKDVIYSALRYLGREQQLFSRMMGLRSRMSPDEADAVSQAIRAFFGDKAFSDYVQLL